MGVWVLIYVKFWGGSVVWLRIVRRISFLRPLGLGFGPNLDHPSDDPHVEIGPAPPNMGGSDPKNSKIEQ